jgi:hypothetical protein
MAITGRDVSILQMAEDDEYGGRIKISKIVWKGATTDEHLCQFIEGLGGGVICEFEAKADGDEFEREFAGPSGNGQVFQNLRLADLDSGEVFVHIV